MTKEERLTLMTTENSFPAVEHWDELLKFFAEHLANVSAKLTENELYPFIAVGGMVFQKKREDAHRSAEVEGAIRKLKMHDEVVHVTA